MIILTYYEDYSVHSRDAGTGGDETVSEEGIEIFLKL